MAKTANLYARIEPEIKEQAEEVLSSLGLPASSAINMFYKQIILQQGLPFTGKIPSQDAVLEETAGKADSSVNEEQISVGGNVMKQFIIVDDNVPMQFFSNCTGCILDKRNKDRVMILTADGESYPVGIDLLHFFSIQLYRKVMEAWIKGGMLFIPDLSGKDDDELRKVLMDLEVVDYDEGQKILEEYMDEIKKL